MIVLKLKASGKVFVVIPFKHRDGFRGGAKTITAARKTHVETWGANSHLMFKTRRHDPHYVVCFLTDVEEYFISDYADWFDPTKRQVRTVTYSRRELWHLPTHLMRHVLSKKELRPE